MQRWASIARWLVTAVASLVLTSFVFGIWYAVYAMSKLGAALNPTAGQDSSGAVTLDAAMTSPLLPAAIIAVLAMLLIGLIVRMLSDRALSSIAPTALLVGSIVAWLAAAAQFASDQWQWPARSLDWMGMSAPGEFLAASVVTLVPGIFALLLVRWSTDR